MMQRDKGNVHAEELDRFIQSLRRNVADVGALHVDHALIGAQLPGQLAVAHIHCVDLDRTVLQHAVGKPAGRCTNVHAHLALGRQRKTLHGLFQLQAAAADITDVVPAHLHLGIFFDHLTGLVHLLFVDKHHTGHDHGLGAFTALDQTMLNQILIQPNFHDMFSPFIQASITCCARVSASSPVTCLICGTVAWGRLAICTAACRKVPFQPACCRQ